MAETARMRASEGTFKGAIDTGSFVLPNPGGGQPLLEDARVTLVRGKRYGLIGRNGKGKSTMLRALAARRVGGIPVNVSVHYVSQEVKLDETTLDSTPVEAVLRADVERTYLLKEAAELDALTEMSPAQQQRQGDQRKAAVPEPQKLQEATTP